MGVGILVEDLNAWYGSNHTLQDINLHIPANHATALIGPASATMTADETSPPIKAATRAQPSAFAGSPRAAMV